MRPRMASQSLPIHLSVRISSQASVESARDRELGSFLTASARKDSLTERSGRARAALGMFVAAGSPDYAGSVAGTFDSATSDSVKK